MSSPHTSAGRIPTAQGYRVFVDSLVHVKSLPISTTVASNKRERIFTGDLVRQAIAGLRPVCGVGDSLDGRCR